VRTIAADLRRRHGAARAVAAIEAKSATSGTVILDFERSTLRLEMSVADAPPHLIESLLVTAADAKGDTVRDVLGAITALPGQVALAAMRLGDGEPKSVLVEQADRPLAIGSAFKLFILAELVREVKAGERRWTDVVPLDRRSLPSGFLQTWPEGAPLTLHSLAALMISQSDNSAADTLLALLGREKVERSLAAFGVRAPERLRPFLSTREAFLLKAGEPSLQSRWIAAGEAARRALLAREVAGQSLEAVDPSRFGAGPLAIGDVEWFASPADLVRTIDWLRRSGDAQALGILAINPGIRSLRRDFAYAGFKGGSETGVLNLSFLLRRRDGIWLAVAVTWNNPAAAVDEGQLVALTSRLLALLAKDPG
jgi:beta-lactamase class A